MMNSNYKIAKTTFIFELMFELVKINEQEFNSLYKDFNAVIKSIHALERKLEKRDAEIAKA